MLVGQHDFTHFASQGNPDPNPVKTIHHFDVLQDADGYVFQVEGSGFLYKMVYLIMLQVVIPVQPLPHAAAHPTLLRKGIIAGIPCDGYNALQTSVARG